MKPIDIDATNFDEFVKGEFVVVDCWSPTCPPCLMLAPVIDKLASKHTNVKFGKVNFSNQANRPIANRFGINVVPTLLVFKSGELVNRLVGYKDEATLEKELGL